jgi:hypothetical protein
MVVRSGTLPTMAIADRTRKILWVKAGGRCSTCRLQLVTEGTEGMTHQLLVKRPTLLRSPRMAPEEATSRLSTRMTT